MQILGKISFKRTLKRPYMYFFSFLLPTYQQIKIFINTIHGTIGGKTTKNAPSAQGSQLHFNQREQQQQHHWHRQLIAQSNTQ